MQRKLRNHPFQIHKHFPNVSDSVFSRNNSNYLNYNSNGFKDLGENLNAGFDINEITSKVRFNSSKDAKIDQSLEFKFHYYDETSNETYLGLTDSDFKKTPFLRYMGSGKDKMDADHFQISLTNSIQLSQNSTYTHVHRNN